MKHSKQQQKPAPAAPTAPPAASPADTAPPAAPPTSEPPAEEPAADGAHVTMHAPEDCNSASHDGVEYPVSARGTIKVPAHAVEHLRHHGFTTDKPSK